MLAINHARSYAVRNGLIQEKARIERHLGYQWAFARKIAAISRASTAKIKDSLIDQNKSNSTQVGR
jgi:hypothetical protein